MTRAWQKSLEVPPPDEESHQPEPQPVDERPSAATHGWHRRELTTAMGQAAGIDVEILTDTDDDPPVGVRGGDQIVPRRAAVSSVEQPVDSLLSSRDFWMGIVFGASVVLVIKTVLAVQAPFGIDWYLL